MTDSQNATVPRPLITIAITCYNAEDTIRRAVMSAIRQTWPNCEIFILDDCSTDRSWEIIQDLIHEFPTLQAIRHQQNRGFAAALNSLLSKARGDFIAFFDDDDESATDRLRLQYERINAYERNHGTSFIFCYSNYVFSESVDTIRSWPGLGIGRSPPEPHGVVAADFRLGLVTGGHYCWGTSGTCTLMARTASLRMAGGFDEKLRRGQDADLFIRAALTGAHFISVNATLVRRHWTETPDKSGTIDLHYQLLRVRKYKAYLRSKRAYLGAMANTCASFYHWKGCHRRGHIWRSFALMLFPWRISSERLKSRRLRIAARAGRLG